MKGLSFDSQAEAPHQRPSRNLLLKTDDFFFSWNHLTENVRLENEAVGGGKRQGVGSGWGGGGARSRIRRAVIYWLEAGKEPSRQPHLFVRSLPSGCGAPTLFFVCLFFVSRVLSAFWLNSDGISRSRSSSVSDGL